MNLNPDPEFWPNLDPDLDPGPDPDLGLCYPIWKEKKIVNNFEKSNLLYIFLTIRKL